MRRFKTSIALLCFASAAWAQVSTSSTYSTYGMGELSRRSSIFNKGLGGTGYALRAQNEINLLNPAAMTIDSLTFLLDVGLSSNFYSLKDNNGAELQTSNTGFEYLAMAFPVTKWWNASLGMFPYSKLGYNYQTQSITESHDTIQYRYNGKGGINQVVLSQAFRPIKDLSVGLSAGFLFGNTERYSFSDTKYGKYSSNLYKDIYHTGLLLDLGAQYSHEINQDMSVTIGALFSMSPVMKYRNRRYLAPYSTTVLSLDSAETDLLNTDIAPTIGAGLGVSKKDVFTLGFDASIQKWKGKEIYGIVSENLRDAIRMSFGGAWTPNRYAPRGYFKRVNYRFGVWYENTYIQIKPTGENAFSGIDAKAVSFGVSLPFRQTMNKIQLSVEYGQRKSSSSALISESFCTFSFGFRIHESWFYKRKYD